jgi:MFS family permease
MRRLSEALINHDYARLWYGQATSTLGDTVFSTTVMLWVATDLARGKPWAPAAVSGVLLATGAGALLVGPLAGVFVDRWNRRATMLRTEVVRGALVMFLTGLSVVPAGEFPVWAWLALLYIVLFVLNAAGQFFTPARFATIADIVTGEADRTRAAGIGQATSALAVMIGPALAAPLLFGVGVQCAFLFNAASYAVSFFAIRSVRPRADARRDSRPDEAQPGLAKQFLAGLRFFGANRFLVTLLIAAVISQCGSGALSALNVFFVIRNLHASAHLYGYLSTALGAGAIAGALCAGRVVGRLGARTTTWAGLLLSGALIVGYSRQTAFLGGVMLLFLLAVPTAMANAAMGPLLLGAASREYMGRVLAVVNPLMQLASMLSVLLAGWLASSPLRSLAGSMIGLRFDSINAILAVSGVLVMIAGAYALLRLSPTVMPEPAGSPADPVSAASR